MSYYTQYPRPSSPPCWVTATDTVSVRLAARLAFEVGAVQLVSGAGSVFTLEATYYRVSPNEYVVEARPWDAIRQEWPDALKGELALQAIVNFTAAQRQSASARRQSVTALSQGTSRTLPLTSVRLGDQPLNSSPPDERPTSSASLAPWKIAAMMSVIAAGIAAV